MHTPEPDSKSETELRAAILQLGNSYFAAARPDRPFVPGETTIPASTKVLDAADLRNLLDASLDLWLTTGRFADEFETALPIYFGRTKAALLVNSGSSANLIAVSSLTAPQFSGTGNRPLQPGDEVITAAAAFPTTVNPIFQNGLVPVFVDVDPRTLNATTESVMAARTPKTRAVILAHTLGNPFRADELAAWCKKEQIILIEDCCDALGAEIDVSVPKSDSGTTEEVDQWRRVGSFGQYATVSFYPAHHITMGEGGAVLSENGKFRKVAESLRDWGRDCWCKPGCENTCKKRFSWKLGDLPEGYDHKYIYSNIGYNLKVTDMQAALGVTQLKKVDHFIAARRRNWSELYQRVTGSPRLRDKLIPITPTQGTRPSWFGFAVQCAPGINRKTLLEYLEQKKIGTRLLFGGNITKQPAYQGLHYRIAGSLAATDAIMHQVFWIACHPGLTAAHIDYMVETLEAWTGW